MMRILMRIPDSDLKAATREAFSRQRRKRLDQEIARCLAETVIEDLALTHEFDGTTGDGVFALATRMP